MRTLAVLCLLASLAVAAPAQALEESISNVAAPYVAGTPTFGSTLTADAGAWTPPGVTTATQWLRDGAPVAGATASTYRLGLADVGHRLSVRVTAHKAGLADVSVSSASTAPVEKAALSALERPRILGAARFGRTLDVDPPRWSTTPTSVQYRWLRDGRPITGAHHRRYAVRVPDVGAHLAVRVTALRAGFETASVRSRQVLGRHRVPLRHLVRYSVTTRGRVTADLAVFKRLAQATYEDPRGWRGAGIGFKRVASGGAFRLVLSQASLLPSFGYPCSSMWSCRVGNNVIINQDRWLGASPMWNSTGGSLRDYRHMVVNHETGHWLGHGHRYCSGPGRLAPVMMQQSKGLHGCRPNPWPTAAERFAPRF
jgi:hypothetical protein